MGVVSTGAAAVAGVSAGDVSGATTLVGAGATTCGSTTGAPDGAVCTTAVWLDCALTAPWIGVAALGSVTVPSVAGN